MECGICGERIYMEYTDYEKSISRSYRLGLKWSGAYGTGGTDK